MKNEEAQFILAAYRPDGRDAGEATFVQALAHAERDPELRRWFERQRQFDAAVAAKLADLAPPPGLREAILAGVRVSRPTAQPRRGNGLRSHWLAAAAAIALLAAIGWLLRPVLSRPSGTELATFALRDLANAHDAHVGHPPALVPVQAHLGSERVPLTEALRLDLAELRRRQCRTVQLAGRELFEICFQRGGVWYHVYIGRRQDFAPGAMEPGALLREQGRLAATAWADADRVYALVTAAGAEALRRAI